MRISSVRNPQWVLKERRVIGGGECGLLRWCILLSSFVRNHARRSAEYGADQYAGERDGGDPNSICACMRLICGDSTTSEPKGGKPPMKFRPGTWVEWMRLVMWHRGFRGILPSRISFHALASLCCLHCGYYRKSEKDQPRMLNDKFFHLYSRFEGLVVGERSFLTWSK
ncbi:hypothetical protein CFELI_12190 [Corynebacterium felinum]|nr:hypothetical protein CFELI_12190 [Corynebacterium felinum]